MPFINNIPLCYTGRPYSSDRREKKRRIEQTVPPEAAEDQTDGQAQEGA